MRVFIVALLIIIPQFLYAGDVYIFPSVDKDSNKTTCDSSSPPRNPYDPSFNEIFEIQNSVDVNNDGICEFFMRDTYAYGNTGLLGIYNEKGEEIGTIGPDFWLAESYNGYAQLVYTWYKGHRTNPIYTVNVLRFNGKKYEKIKTATCNEYKKLALKYYRGKDYQNAEKYFLSVFRMKGEKDIKSANDLALTWIKQGKYSNAKQLLIAQIDTSDDDKDKANAYYNLGIVYEELNQPEKAFEAYQESFKLHPTESRKKKLNKLRF